jgi:hypothetical protein
MTVRDQELRAPPAAELSPTELPVRAADSRLYRVAAEQLSEVRCPICRTTLVVRFDCLGPYFACLCHPGRWR